MLIDLQDLSPNRIYFTMIQTLIPRPVAWVLSDNGDDSLNLAPFSYFSGVCSKPPLVMLSIGKKPDGDIKDTRLNILERKHFVVHIAHREMMEQVTQSSMVLPHGESELAASGLQTTPFGDFALPRISDCRVAYACELYEHHEIGAQAIIYGLVKQIYLSDDIARETDGRLQVDAKALDPIARLGGDDYSLIGDIRTIPRPKPPAK
ncbi:flavin reductase (DIM6/NTAB) family NADH-FMN oxidoreductase RutF [Litorivivens lipolytica]|uniref:Flavin reductase (DIM6/NTAB) family NADH-FMN oxidoreductase RutF n=1 Tax=Litorivivens lipolytica TaxID=1524264 RepID=A0A7W4Z748_9GAMM|nr:flavin reductase family protein [Litorivivens lipolytica]MBB3047551.1 flavin reductase (DIM6/NTAB) family NADH-FMN oxidoreductase RutF [Litorivivens lipolytica]